MVLRTGLLAMDCDRAGEDLSGLLTDKECGVDISMAFQPLRVV